MFEDNEETSGFDINFEEGTVDKLFEIINASPSIKAKDPTSPNATNTVSTILGKYIKYTLSL